MNPKTYNRILQGTIAVLCVAFAGQVGYQYWFNKPDPVLMAAWAFEPRNLAEAKGLAKEIVEAQVTNVERADDLVIPAEGEPGNVERIAIEVVSMNVKGAMKGQPGQQVQIFRTAGLPVSRHDMPNMKEAPPKPQGASDPPARPTPFMENTINIHDDQEYKVGENYVMFLRDGPQVRVKGRQVATKTLLNPSTRFLVERDNSVRPLIPDGLGQAFQGKPLQQFKATIQEVKEIGPMPGKIPGQLILPKLQIKPGMMPGMIRPRGIEGGEGPEGMEAEIGEMEVPTEGEAPALQ
ncbi:MAG: hypothetical protein AB7P17_11540 [Nitrospirales bacterium]|nr:hypothetical protein [Nitrospirales bacterium]